MYDYAFYSHLVSGVLMIVIPAYMANAFAFLFGGGKPIDCGRNFLDGRRILGDGKTVRGLFSGIIFGTLGGILITIVIYYLNFLDVNYYFLLFSFIVATGAILGDITGAFIKRRVGLNRGAPVPGLDQLNFILLALALAYIFTSLIPIFKITLLIFAIVLIVTPFAHIISCILAYKTGKKREPW